MFELCQFSSKEAHSLASFLYDLRKNYWSLTSLAYQRRPDVVPQVQAEELILSEQQPRRIGTFLLKYNGRIISTLQIDDKHCDGKVALFFGAETHPEFQRRGTFWRHLLKPCLRQTCKMGFERLEATTWTFNRKGIPLYKRIGFRSLPGTSLTMENYLPLILRQPAVQAYFNRYDYIRTLQNRRSYGYDNLHIGGSSVFEYRWKSKAEELIVHIDWQSKQITSIQRLSHSVRCKPH